MNWGLGHATRSVPLVEEFIKQDYQVDIASDGEALTFLRERFPKLKYFELPPYNITYSRQSNQIIKIASQVPKIISKIKKENKVIIDLCKNESYSCIVSDNRFGAYHETIYSVFISHQINIQSPFMSGLIKKLNINIINKFDECWIPDFEPPHNLGGELSIVHDEIKKYHYIGNLSHLSIRKKDQVYNITYLLSGPEPQRSILEEKIIAQHPDNLKGLLIRGSQAQSSKTSTDSLEIVNLLCSDELSEKLSQSSIVVCRSGYSSLMDLVNSHLKVILIPTPGQTEQEYLANRLSELGAYSIDQESYKVECINYAQKIISKSGSFNDFSNLIYALGG